MQRNHNSRVATSIAAAFLSCASALAQPCPGHWIQASGAAGIAAPDYQGGGGQMLMLPSGDLLVCGGFTIAGNTGAQSVALYSPATQQWSGFGWVDGGASTAALLPNGDVILGGLFTSIAGQPANNVALYHAQTQSWSPAGTGVTRDDPYVGIPHFAVLPNGDVIAGGHFNHAGGLPSNLIARYSPASNTWTPIPGLTDGYINSLAATAAGDVIIGGNFTLSGESQPRFLARYSPATGAWSNMGLYSGTSIVQVVTALPNGTIAIGGNFQALSNSLQLFNRIALYNPATDAWTRLTTGVGGTSSATVFDIVQTTDGDIVACGSFSSAAGQPASCIARFRPSYNQWFAMGSGFFGSNWPVMHLAALPGGDVIGGGFFYSADNIGAKCIARWSSGTNTWSPLSQGMVAHISAAAPLPDGKLLVAARFSGSLANVARYDLRSNSWDVIPDTVENVSAMTTLPNEDVVAAGSFTHLPGNPTSPLAVYHAATGTWTPLPAASVTGPYAEISALAVLPSGDLLVGGTFTTAGSVAAANIATFNMQSAQWSALGAGVPSTVVAIDILPDGDLLAAGPGLRRYHPATGVWTTVISGSLNAMTALPSGDVVVGGVGSTLLARYSPSTNTTTPIAGLYPSNTVAALAYVEPNQLIVGGDVYSAGGAYSPHLLRYDLSTGAWSGFAGNDGVNGTDGQVTFLTSLGAGEFLASGEFTRVGPISSAFAARWVTVSADYNRDGDVGTDADIEAFFACLSGSCCALCSSDFNGDGDTGTDADIEAFFRVLAGGAC